MPDGTRRVVAPLNDSPAERAGLRSGDRIIAIGGKLLRAGQSDSSAPLRGKAGSKVVVKVVRGEAEHAKVAIRNIRRDANGDFKDLLKEKEISEDEARRGEEQIQQLTDRMVGEVEKMLKIKEEELMTV